MTTKEEILKWFDEGVRHGYTHMIVVCDTFDHEDYPVYVLPTENIHDKYKLYNMQNMQRVMEIYKLEESTKEAQILEYRAFNF